MSFNVSEFQELTNKYGRYAGWAIWEYEKLRAREASTDCIYHNLADLNSKNIVIGLNVSASIDKDWQNFRGGRHDRKLKYAFNDSVLRGSYITDLYKGIIDPNSLSLHRGLEKGIIEENVEFFNQEMRDIGLSRDSRFILLGTETSIVGMHFKMYFQKYFPANPAIFYRHYSSRGTDENWVTGIWSRLGIQKNFEETLILYK